MDNIDDNMKRFIKDYYIIGSLSKIPKYVNEHVRHRIHDFKQFYKTNSDQYVIVISSYSVDDEPFIKTGWIKIYPLHDYKANTYIKIIDLKYRRNKSMFFDYENI